MNEKNREEQAAEARMAEMLSAALAEELGDMPKVSITVEELEALERADRQQRRKRRLRYFSMAAAVFFICVVALYALWPETAVPVSADKNTEQRVEEQNGEIIINEGDVEGGGSIAIREEDWEKVLQYKEDLPKLYLPNYVPKGYNFSYSELNKHNDSEYDITYIFKKGKQEFFIKYTYYGTSGTGTRTLAGENTRIRDTNLGRAYMSTDDQNNLATIVPLEFGILYMNGALKEKETVDILNKMQMP